MKKFVLISICLFCFHISHYGQNWLIDSQVLQLQKYAAQIQEDATLMGRLRADSMVTKMLIQIIKQPHSFQFGFDSLQSIKHIVSPDKRFKIFSWQIDLGDGTYRQRGAIQMSTLDGQLQLYPLFDQSDFVQNNSLGVSDAQHWMGAIYYEIIPIEKGNETLYTLLGYDEYTNGISRKIIEILEFKEGKPFFGGDYFMYPKDPTYPIAPVDRFVLYYKKGSNALIQFNPITKNIQLSELTSTDKDLSNPSNLVPSGNDHYFKWESGKWRLY